MNYPMIAYIVGFIMKIEGAFMALPLITCLVYKEHADARAFVLSIIILLIPGFLLTAKKPRDAVFYAREGFVIVALAWIILSVFGAIPFRISGAIPHYIDALFEMISGFTTTGSSILANVEALSHGMLFWRSFSHWIGGMGVLVFVLAIIPASDGRSMHLMRAESPGPSVGKLAPRVKTTARILYLIYAVLSAVCFLMLWAGGMPAFDSLLHMFGTAGTGGFGIKSASIGFYDSAYIDGVITVFMILFGVNFSVYYLVLTGKSLKAFKNEEVRWYIIIILLSIGLIMINIHQIYGNAASSFRYAAFQVGSIITTTGYSTVDYNLWPTFSKAILVLLTIFGACAGSTAGGIKISRLILMYKSISRGIQQMLHPRSVNVMRLDGKKVEDTVIGGVHIYMLTYLFIAGVSFLLLSLNELDFISTTTALLACLNNVGPGLGMVGPAGNFGGFSVLSKIVLSADMLLGRLEIFPVLMLFAPSVWRMKKTSGERIPQ